jgi:hypothetical protein
VLAPDADRAFSKATIGIQNFVLNIKTQALLVDDESLACVYGF